MIACEQAHIRLASGPPGARVMGKPSVKKCETFGCQESGSQILQIAPGTTVWLCKLCAYRETKALGRINEPYDKEEKPAVKSTSRSNHNQTDLSPAA